MFKAGRSTTEYNKYITDAECQQILEYADQQSAPVRLAIHLMHKLGIRVSEAITLRVQDVDFKNNIINVVAHKQGKIIPRIVPKSLIDMIFQHVEKNYKDIWASKGYLCYVTRGHYSYGTHISKNTIMWFFKTFRKKHGYEAGYYVRKNGRKMTRFASHVLRSHWITKMMEKVQNIRIVQMEIGHAKPETTWRYVRHAERQKIMKNAVDDLF